MPGKEDEEEVLWPYGKMTAVLATIVWMVILTVALSLTTIHLGWPSPGMRAIVAAGLAFYGFIPLVLLLLDKIFEMIYGTVERDVISNNIVRG